MIIYCRKNVYILCITILAIFNIFITHRLISISKCSNTIGSNTKTLTKIASNQLQKSQKPQKQVQQQQSQPHQQQQQHQSQQQPQKQQAALNNNELSINKLNEPPQNEISLSQLMHLDSIRRPDLQDIDSIPLSNVNFHLGRFDNQNLYKYYDFVSIGRRYDYNIEDKICLATQSSIERLHFIAQVAANWNGAISLAIYVSGNEEFNILQYYLTYLENCYENIRDNVNIHLAVPKDRIPYKFITDLSKYLDLFSSCKISAEAMLQKLLKIRTVDTIKYRLRTAYPQNHLRNLARKGCQSKKVLLTDVDIIPNINLANQLETFFEKQTCKGLCAYVIPTFELDVRTKFPQNRAELLRLVKKGLARPFHEKVFIYNQFATNFSKWIQNDKMDGDIVISHNVTNFEFLYEPFYIADNTAPMFDERFLGYGFTRNSQVYEMYLAGYQFQVLIPAFTCHWGLQRKKVRPAWREQQNNINRKKFEIFNDEISVRYRKKEKDQKSKGKKT
ncbi:beta-1,4-glucuronyltransferase 1 [Condylostylus longicornis]|uniref:beta-1,4-glucuronyltransferase 1 n=1 Tax=Condylostylus longicornis TaxID=2530218 RepID=UPI00244DB09C|nr:beta-1,4-glucuronyltransferase 1 [Condylostylus longicornis]